MKHWSAGRARGGKGMVEVATRVDAATPARVGIAVAAVSFLAAGVVLAGNHAPNPYGPGEAWGELPEGRPWGATSAIYPANDGKHLWVAERCGANSCVGSDFDPVMLFDGNGTLVRSFGAGIIAWPHGIFVDADDNVWVADGTGYAAVPDGIGHAVFKFSPEGELLMTLGRPGDAGSGEQTLRKPTDVAVAANGDIFVADGHKGGRGEPANNRIVKYDPAGRFIDAWGTAGTGPGEFDEPHAIAIDSQGRVFVADRYNNRVQVFDQNGEHLATWTQFGRPSGIYIDVHDIIYVTDSESNARRNPGWKRGIRIADARDGFVFAFIPDPEPDQDERSTSGAEGVAVDAQGRVYGAEVGPRGVKRYERRETPVAPAP
jgi:sugar lactone lactonase YvrE